MLDELEQLAEEIRYNNRNEVAQILGNDEKILQALDFLFLIADEPPSTDYINGFTTALLVLGKIKTEEEKNRLNDLIASHRNLLQF